MPGVHTDMMDMLQQSEVGEHCENQMMVFDMLGNSERSMFPEVSVFPDTGEAQRTQGLDSFQFLRHSVFAEREKESEEAPITKLWTEYGDNPYTQSMVNEAFNEEDSKGGVFSAWGGASKSSSVLEHATTTTATTTTSTKPKRKRSRPCKSSEEVESQRMTHIAVERNRRRQMNEHLRVLRQLMPGSYVQRGDQASIIGGAIEFVKELQQLLQCLEEQKKRKMTFMDSGARLMGSPVAIQTINGGFPCVRPPPPSDLKYLDVGMYEPFRELYGEARTDVASVEVKIVGMTGNIKILSQKKPGQLLKTMTALETKLAFTIVHTNVTTIEQTVLYSFEVKVGQNCGLAEDIAAFIHDTLATSILEELQH